MPAYDDDEVIVINNGGNDKVVAQKDKVFAANQKETQAKKNIATKPKQAVSAGDKAMTSLKIAKAKMKIANTKLSAAQAKKDRMKRKEAEEALLHAKQAQEEVDRIARLANINRQLPNDVMQVQALQSDDQGGQYFTGQDGVEYYLDKEGNYFYLASDGKYYILEPEETEEAASKPPTDEAKQPAEEAKPPVDEVVVDENGGQYFTGDDGVEYYLDKDGNYFYLASDGQYHFLEQEEEETKEASQVAQTTGKSASGEDKAAEGHYYVGDDGYNYYQDASGAVFYEADDGKYYPLQETKSKTKAAKTKAEKKKDKKNKSGVPENDVDDVITKKKLTQRFGFKMTVLVGILVFVLAVVFGALGGSGYFNAAVATFQFTIDRQNYIGNSGDFYVCGAKQIIRQNGTQLSGPSTLNFDIRINFNGPATGSVTVSVEGSNVVNISKDNGVTKSKRIIIYNNQTITIVPNTIVATQGIQEVTTSVGGLFTLVAENSVAMGKLPILIDREMFNLTAPAFKLSTEYESHENLLKHNPTNPIIIRAPENPNVAGSPMKNFSVPSTVDARLFRGTTGKVGALPIPTNNSGVAVDPSQFLRNVIWEVVEDLPSSFMSELSPAERLKLPKGTININRETGAMEAVKSGFVNLRAGVKREYSNTTNIDPTEWKITSYVIAVVDVEADTLNYVWPESKSFAELKGTMTIGTNEKTRLGLDSENKQRVLPKGLLADGLNDWVMPDAAGISTNFFEQLNAVVIPARDIVGSVSSLVTKLDATYLLDTDNFVLVERGGAGRVSINWFFDENGEKQFVIYATQDAEHGSTTIIDIYLQGSLIGSNKFGTWLSERVIRFDAKRNHSVMFAQQGVFFPSPIELSAKGTVNGVANTYTSPMLNQVLAAGRYNILLSSLAQVYGHNFTFSDLYFSRTADLVPDDFFNDSSLTNYFVTVVDPVTGVREVYARAGSMWDSFTKDTNGNIRIWVQLRNGNIVLDRVPIDIHLN